MDQAGSMLSVLEKAADIMANKKNGHHCYLDSFQESSSFTTTISRTTHKNIVSTVQQKKKLERNLKRKQQSVSGKSSSRKHSTTKKTGSRRKITNYKGKNSQKSSPSKSTQLPISAKHCTAKGDGLTSVYIGKNAFFTITPKNNKGQKKNDNHDSFNVEAKNCKLEVAVTNKKNGTYSVRYRILEEVTMASIHLSIHLGTKHISGSPFNVPIMRKYRCYIVRTWGSKGKGNGKFHRPGGITIYKNHVYVTDRFNHRIQVFQKNGKFIRAWGSNGTGLGDFRNPASVALCDGSVYVADTSNHRIQVFSMDATFIRSWGSSGSGQGQFRNPYGLSITSNKIFVGDCGNHRIQVFDHNGIFINMWGRNGTGEGELSYPYAVAVDKNENLVYVADRNNHRIQVFSTSGTFIRMWGHCGPRESQISNPEGLALANGLLYLTEYNKNHVKVFLRDGTFIQTLWSNKGKNIFTCPVSITMDRNTAYVAESSFNHIKVVNLVHLVDKKDGAKQIIKNEKRKKVKRIYEDEFIDLFSETYSVSYRHSWPIVKR